MAVKKDCPHKKEFGLTNGPLTNYKPQFGHKTRLKYFAYIDRVPYFYSQLKIPFSCPMQIWQLFIVLRLSVTISVTVFSNLKKLTNDL